MSDFPMQPVERANGVIRFKPNRIVRAVLERSRLNGFGLNEIAEGDFTLEEGMQFAQLIGYTISGYSELSYVTDESYAAATELVSQLRADELKESVSNDTELDLVESVLMGYPDSLARHDALQALKSIRNFRAQ